MVSVLRTLAGSGSPGAALAARVRKVKMTGRTFLDPAVREGVTVAPSREDSLIGKVRIGTIGTGVRGRSLLRAVGGLRDVDMSSLSDADGRLVEHNDADDESDQRLRNPGGCIPSPALSSADVLTGHLSTIDCQMTNIMSGRVRNLGLDQKTETIVDVPHANLYVKRDCRTHGSTQGGA